MTTIKVKLRPSTVPGKPGTLYYQLTHQRIVRHITTNIHLHPHQWDPTTQLPTSSAPDSTTLTAHIHADLQRLTDIITHLSPHPYTTDDIITHYHQHTQPVTVLQYIRQQAQQLHSTGHTVTARNYTRAHNSLARFLDQRDIPFSALTTTLIDRYNYHLTQRGIVRNSISFYMRILRSVYNKAVQAGHAPAGNPFAHVYTGTDTTRKRAISESTIAELNRLSLPPYSPLDQARDLFIFSYCTRGMAFVDIIHLRKADLRDGYLCYARHKTHHPLYIKVESGIQRILQKYAVLTQHTPYLFPILQGDDEEADFRRYQQALNTHNRMLKKLSTQLTHPCTLTSYVARHSWATAARNHNIPLSIISEGMGHTSERTTRIYLSSLENSVIDAANHEILRALQC